MITLKRLQVENFKLLRSLDLLFPDQGSVLVEGLNESGKSTLFESVFYALYGSPLASEGRGKGNLESAVRYGEDSMSVELLLEVDETELEIRRSVKRNRGSQARLFVRRPGTEEEQIAGVLAVNARIVAELGGLDGEALLNSCFVEQKKLSKLEDLVSSQRKDSLRKLLNLDRLTALAERFRVTPQDERALSEARGRLELAEVALQLPAVAAERSNLEAAMRGESERGRERVREGVTGALVSSNLSDSRTGGSPPAVRAGGIPALPANPHPDPLPGGEGVPEGLPEGVQGARPGGEGDIGHSARVIRYARNGVVEDVVLGEEGDSDSRSPGNETARFGGNGGPDQFDGSAWHTAAVRLEGVRSAAAKRNRAAALWLTIAAAMVAAAMVAALLGFQQALWGVALALVPAIAAWSSRRSARSLEAEAAHLQRELSAHRDVMVARAGELESRRRRTEESLGVEAVALDVEECRREVERLERQIEVKRTAAAIIEGAMERIVRMVLPNTERNLGQILPLLTAGRYHEARIGEDYQVQVWDDSAGRYVSKGIFSGGARDQFSLALRLAFALATLPEELGTTPGFIFLDEPLSSFDGPRTEALVRLLTEGQVAANFSQIFVISHNRSFDLNAFQYRLVLRDGRVVESNLPRSGGEGWDGGEGREGRSARA